MKLVIAIIAAGLMGGTTYGAYQWSVHGTQLDGPLDEPVSIRQDSRPRTRRSGVGGAAALYFFGTRSRRHSAGGFRGGK